MDEHRSAVQRVEVEVSDLAEHVWKLNYRVDWGHVAILDCNTLEACHITRQSIPWNRDRCMLPMEYNRLLKSSEQQTC